MRLRAGHRLLGRGGSRGMAIGSAALTGLVSPSLGLPPQPRGHVQPSVVMAARATGSCSCSAMWTGS